MVATQEKTPNKGAADELRPGVKAPANATILSPRFYTTDFEEMAEMDVSAIAAELEAIIAEFKVDYNRHHFVRNEQFEGAWDHIQGERRQVFIEFLERSCTAEFSGFLLYKELARKLKGRNPLLAEGFDLMSRDEARHAGFLNKAMSDFDLQLDLGFLTKSKKYTFFKPKIIFYATYARLWCRFFLLSVFATMYLNDIQRKSFYAALGLDAREYDIEVIKKTNESAGRLFPIILDVEDPRFFAELDKCTQHTAAVSNISKSGQNKVLQTLRKIPHIIGIGSKLINLYFMKPISMETSRNTVR